MVKGHPPPEEEKNPRARTDDDSTDVAMLMARNEE